MQPASMLDIFGWPQCYKVVLQKVQVSNSWKGQADLQHRWGCREGADKLSSFLLAASMALA